MKNWSAIILFLMFSMGLIDSAWSQVTRNQSGDSVRILFYLEYQNKPYEIANIGIYAGDKQFCNSKQPVDGIVEMLLPTTTFVHSRKNLSLKVSHK